MTSASEIRLGKLMFEQAIADENRAQMNALERGGDIFNGPDVVAARQRKEAAAYHLIDLRDGK